MNRLLLLVAVGFLAPAAQAKTVVVTDVQNKKAITLIAGDTLIVRLAVKPGTGRQWHVVYDPQAMLHLSREVNFISLRNSPRVAVSQVGEEFRFTVPYSRSNGLDGFWLRFLYLSPLEPSIGSAKVWAIQYTIKAAK